MPSPHFPVQFPASAPRVSCLLASLPLASLLLASLLLAGCSTTDAVDVLLDEAAESSSREAPPPEETYGSYGEAPRGEAKDEGVTRITLGAWGMDGRVQGHASGAPSEHGMDATAIPGFSLEASFLSHAEGAGKWSSIGILLENFHDGEEKTVAGGAARTEGSLTAAWLVVGTAGDPRMDSRERPVDFGYRFDLLLGIRRGAVKVEVPDPAGGSYRRSSVWGEFAIGARGEWSPCRRVSLFVRGDIGSEGNSRFSSDDQETAGDAAIGSVSSQFMAGVRVRPVQHLSLVAGWRYLRLDGKEFLNGGTEDEPTARAVWSGPWAGLELDF